MRFLSVGLALLVATGCTTNQVGVQHTAQLETRTRGLALLDDEASSLVGMSANSCQVDTSSGAIGMDVDVAPGEDDYVTDAVGTDAIIVGQGGVYVLDGTGFGSSEPMVPMANVSDARLTQNLDIVALSNDGTVTWNGADPVQTSGASDFAIDRITGTAFVVDGNGLTAVTPGGVTSTAAGAYDLVAYDPATDAVYVAAVGGTEVRALEVNGTQRWAAELGGFITSLDDMGSAGSVAIMMELDSGMGELVVLDGRSGEQLSSITTPSAAEQVLVGNNGESMALVLPSEVHFFTVDAAE